MKNKCCDNPKCQETAVIYNESLTDVAMQLIDADVICDEKKAYLFKNLSHMFAVVSHGLDCTELSTQKMANLDNSAIVLVPQESLSEIMPIIQKHIKNAR